MSASAALTNQDKPLEHILLEKVDGIATITLNRPDALNALTPAMLKTLCEQFTALGNDDSIKVVVLTGAGKAFTAGVDLKSLNKITPVNGKISDEIDQPGQQLTQIIDNLPKPVIAKVNGFCFTGGLEIALACDLLYAANEAKLGDTHAKWGIRPSWGMSQRLPRRVGVLKAKEMTYTARFVSGSEAQQIGLVNQTVPVAELDDLVRAVCQQIIGNSSATLAACKDLYRATDGSELQDGLQYEWSTSYEIDDTAERLADFIK